MSDIFFCTTFLLGGELLTGIVAQCDLTVLFLLWECEDMSRQQTESTAEVGSELLFQKVHLTAEGALIHTPELQTYISIMLIPTAREFFPGTSALGLLRSYGWQCLTSAAKY